MFKNYCSKCGSELEQAEWVSFCRGLCSREFLAELDLDHHEKTKTPRFLGGLMLSLLLFFGWSFIWLN